MPFTKNASENANRRQMNNFPQRWWLEKKNAMRKPVVFQLGTINSNRLICEYQIPSRSGRVIFSSFLRSRVDRTNSVIVHAVVHHFVWPQSNYLVSIILINADD